MKKITLLTLLLLGTTICSYAQSKEKQKLKQVEYRVCVIADKPGVDYFGGKKSFQKKLVGLFDNVTRFWNNGSNDFDYYFKFIPTLHAVFEGSSKDVLRTYGGDDFDFKKYDVLVMFDMIKDHADEHPGAAAGGVKNGLCGIYVRNGDSLKMKEIFTDGSILPLYLRSVGVALASAAIGTAVAFAAAMIRARSNMPGWCRTAMDGFAMLTSTLPGMVLGVGFLFAFSGTFLQNTIWILILANLVHFLSTPYIMATTALSKMNASWETTGILMGDSWFKSVRRIVVPNARATLVEMFQTYFVNSMVTISAIVFLAGSRTMVLTTRIKELQYYERFDAIFVLSVLIFLTNVVAKVVLDRLAKTKSKKGD